MTSWGGTSMVISRRLMRTMRSMGEKIRMMPGPLGFSRTRPRRKTTARSYSRRILIEFRMYSTIRPMTMMGNVIMTPSSAAGAVLPTECPGSSLLDPDLQILQDLDDADLLAGAHRGARGLGLPELAVDEDLALRGQVGPGRADLAHHALFAGERPAPVGAHDDRDEEDEDQR